MVDATCQGHRTISFVNIPSVAMSASAQQIDEVIKLGLADLLRQHGYKKSTRNWHLARGENWLIVNVQASTGNIGNQSRFTINLGVYSTAIAMLAGEPPPAGRPKEHEATIRERLGALAFGADYWWSIDAESSLPLIANDVVEKMKSVGLPWLNAHSEVAQISEALKDSPSLVSVCAAWLAGNKVEAIRRLRNAIAFRPAAHAYFTAWASKNGVQL